MERVWAAIDGNTITNTFVGDDDFADLVRAEHDEVVEITDLSPMPAIGWIASDDGYRPVSPFPSWVWRGDAWGAPVLCPDTPGSWVWDEDAAEWRDATPQTGS